MDLNKKLSSQKIFLLRKTCQLTEQEVCRFLFQMQKDMLNIKNLKISKFGTFKRKISPARIGRNPKTMKEYPIPDKLKIYFKASNKIKNLFN